MRTRLALISSVVVMGVSLANAQIYTESGRVPEPWSGWWWPWYHDTLDTSWCCPHLWQGPNIDSGSPGPLYDLDTKYFWRPESLRSLAQMWECDSHRVYDSSVSWAGHCNGVSCAQVLELDPPSDCGALTQDDLEGLLSEVYMNCWSDSLAGPRTKPSDLWLALRKCLGSTAPSPHALVVDFDTTITPQGDSVVWDWPVFAYEIGCGLANDTARGTMTLCYEGHKPNAQHDSCVASYGFWCEMRGLEPVPNTGGWSNCQGPGGNT